MGALKTCNDLQDMTSGSIDNYGKMVLCSDLCKQLADIFCVFQVMFDKNLSLFCRFWLKDGYSS